MEIIFIRHGRAEDLQPAQTDIDRRLTASGIRKVRLAAKGLKHLINAATAAQIWTSPAARCRETAAILAEELGITQVIQDPAIYSGKLGQLITAWQSLQDTNSLVVIGHEPYLSMWLKQLTNIPISFKKCAAAGVKYSLLNETTSLQWYASPKILARMGSREAAATT